MNGSARGPLPADVLTAAIVFTVIAAVILGFAIYGFAHWVSGGAI